MKNQGPEVLNCLKPHNIFSLYGSSKTTTTSGIFTDILNRFIYVRLRSSGKKRLV